MAITKIGSRAIIDGSILAADFAPGSVPSDKLAGSIENSKLSNSTITIGGQAISLGGTDNSLNLVDWQSKITSDGSTVTTMVAGRGYFVDNSSAAGLVKLPASASIGDFVAIKDYAGNFGTNNLTIQRNSHNIQGVAIDSSISTNRASVVLVYVDATKGWLYTDEHNVDNLGKYIAATGGTVTTSGDFKVHTFTGDGCFVVSKTGGSPTFNTVDYLVVAGGGGAGGDGGGGGGAGGFRVSNSLGLPAPTMSPLSNPTGLTLNVQTYPVTVGGGGASPGTGDNPGASVSSGSNSIFSTITSSGGGAGGNSTGTGQGANGGSGGGSSKHIENSPGTSGNTPPVSPPQGNDGGSGNATTGSSGGGGGAGGAGAIGYGPLALGDGGVGSYVSPSLAVSCAGTPGPVGSVRYFSGGGGGGGDFNAPPFPNSGGAGGGGNGVNNNCTGSPGTNGTANTGGGAGAGGNQASGTSGGSGIVVIRYKYQ